MIAVTTVYPIEARWIRRRRGVRLLRTPAGVRSADGLDASFATETPNLLLSTGFAGGLDANLDVGSLVLADAVRHRDTEIVVAEEILDRARRALERGGHSCRIGPFVCVEAVADRATKRDLARSGAVAIDMESGPLGDWAERRGIPFLAFRAVLDPIDVGLPFSMDRPIAMSVARHPFAALRVGRAAAQAGRALGRALDDLISAWEEGR